MACRPGHGARHRRLAATAPLALVALTAFGGPGGDPGALHPGELELRLASDAVAVATYRAGLQHTVQRLEADTELLPKARLAAPRVLRREQREEVIGTWSSVLDYILALDSVGSVYSRFWTLGGEARDDAFTLRYAAFLAQYRNALVLVARVENDPGLVKALDEPVGELGLPAGSYSKLKLRFLNVERAAELAAFEVMHKGMRTERMPLLEAGIAADAAVIWELGQGRAEVLTAANALAVVKGMASTVTFPVQAGVAEWMGDQKVHRRHVDLITLDQIRAVQPALQPGDILLERREWYLSNIGLPGYWPHAALYVGTPAERAAFFAGEEVAAWVRAQGVADGSLESLLAAREPSARAASQATENGHEVRVLEAISEGVVFTSLEHSASADSLAVLRPRLAKPARAAAMVRAFHYTGRPYDFDFDFATDAALVCTELVYKAYEPAPGTPGLRLPVERVMGRTAMPANLIARLYDSELGAPGQQLDLVLFLDSDERASLARPSTEAAFRESWKRPKWHILKAP